MNPVIVVLLFTLLPVAQVGPASAQPSPLPPLGTAQSAVSSEAVTKLFVVHFTTGKAWDAAKPPNEQVGMPEHSANLARLRREGKLVTGARYQDSHADKGMVVVRAASKAEVASELARDPMVSEGRFNADIAEFSPFYDGYVSRPARPDGTTPLARFAWLAGCWEGKNGSALSREHWMREGGGMMMAMARTVRDGRVLSHEAILLELDADGVTPVYVPKPSNQKEARFKLVSALDGRFVFENPEHDFPQRIIYHRQPDGALLARIEGSRDGKTRGIDYPMTRASCE